MTRELISVFLPTYLGRGNGDNGFIIWREENGNISIVFFYSVVQVAQLMRMTAPSPYSREYFAWEHYNQFIQNCLITVTTLPPMSATTPTMVTGRTPWQHPSAINLAEADSAWALCHLLENGWLGFYSESDPDHGVMRLACNYMARCLDVPAPV